MERAQTPLSYYMDVLSLKGMLYIVAGGSCGKEVLFAVDLNASQKITNRARISYDFGYYHDVWVFLVESSGEIMLIIYLHKWGPEEITFRVFRLADKTFTLVEVESLVVGYYS